MTKTRLYINVDHVATIRQARRTDEPDPVAAALVAEASGADGITVHLREDRRHIQDDDVRRLAKQVGTVLNLELSLAPEILEIARRVEPYQATLVPERREEITTEGGLDIRGQMDPVKEAVERLKEAGIRVSVFIDPDADQIDAAAELGVPAIELHTGRYANAWRDDPMTLQQLVTATDRARSLGLAVHAGHGLTYRNVGPVAAIAGVDELNIGHSIVSRAVTVGIGAAVAEMVALVKGVG